MRLGNVTQCLINVPEVREWFMGVFWGVFAKIEAEKSNVDVQVCDWRCQRSAMQVRSIAIDVVAG